MYPEVEIANKESNKGAIRNLIRCTFHFPHNLFIVVLFPKNELMDLLHKQRIWFLKPLRIIVWRLCFPSKSYHPVIMHAQSTHLVLCCLASLYHRCHLLGRWTVYSLRFHSLSKRLLTLHYRNMQSFTSSCSLQTWIEFWNHENCVNYSCDMLSDSG